MYWPGCHDLRDVKSISLCGLPVTRCRQRRPYWKGTRKKQKINVEYIFDRLECNLTIFKIRFGELTLKMYTKGKAVLRCEIVAQNAYRRGVVFLKGCGQYSTALFSLRLSAIFASVNVLSFGIAQKKG